jgi:hypothetical protein
VKLRNQLGVYVEVFGAATAGQSRIAPLGVCALVALFTLRCGGDVGPLPSEYDGRSGRAPEPVRRAEASALASAQCDYLERCDPDAMFLFSDASRVACEEYFSCRAARFGAKALESLDHLTVCIDSLEMRECPDALREPTKRFSFEKTFPWGPLCGELTFQERFVAPPDAPSAGEACIRPLDERAVCAPGSYCMPEALPVIGRYFCGTCERRPRVGERCGGLPLCVEGARCLEGECRWVREIGESCESENECRFHRCVDSVCFPSEDTPTPYAAVVGRECDRDKDCGRQASLYCDDGSCRPLPDEGESCAPTEVRLGSASHNPFHALAGKCRLGHECIDGRCRALGCNIDLGVPCSGNGSGRCVDGVRVTQPRAGDLCDSRRLSAGGLSEPMCTDGLPCVEGRCTPREVRGNGGRCDFDRDCSSGFCKRHYPGRRRLSLEPCDGCGVCADPPTIELCE